MIHIEHLSYIYEKSGKGVNDISFDVAKGEIVGFLGPNGSGKTTTIRCLLGFLHGQSGVCQLDGADCFENAPPNMERVGFIAGETAFPDNMTAGEYLKFIISARSNGDKTKSAEMTNRKNQLCEMFDLNFKGKIAKMSNGMKQKLAIVSAFLHNPDILILDEPSSGLDPLMQAKFVDLILDMKKMGRTVLMSSHIFEEIAKTSDKVVIIRAGKIVETKKISELRSEQPRKWTITTKKGVREEKVARKDTDKFLKKLAAGKDEIEDINVEVTSLEDIFMTSFSSPDGKLGIGVGGGDVLAGKNTSKNKKNKAENKTEETK
jgi:ABC-2 type transport system ATP-binding protein